MASVKELLKLKGRRRAGAMLLRSVQASFDEHSPVAVGACATEAEPRWLSREELHAKIFARIRELGIPLDADEQQPEEDPEDE